ncbi:unnamed protein product [Cuscuta europaea]|uniref:Uncharacterized protein n=1 Tax=Cuscuta europaea TaxID=41803 RepID=A0A9P0Z9J6_CUSEU|nr:unnamed protein product [Cuscuta europaea]
MSAAGISIEREDGEDFLFLSVSGVLRKPNLFIIGGTNVLGGVQLSNLKHISCRIWHHFFDQHLRSGSKVTFNLVTFFIALFWLTQSVALSKTIRHVDEGTSDENEGDDTM